MDEGNAVGLVKALGFVAWADERIAPEEREMLDTVMAALKIPTSRRDQLVQALAQGPHSIEQIREAFNDDIERRFAVAQAILLARADGDFAAIEKTRIKELASALGIDEPELAMIYAAVDVTDDLMPAL